MARFILLMILGVILASCASPATIQDRPLIDLDQPVVGDITIASPGQAIAERSRYRIADALRASDDIQWTVGLARVEYKIPAGVLIASRRNNQYTYYMGTAQGAGINFTIDGKTFYFSREIRINNSGPAVFSDESIEGEPFVKALSSPKLERITLRLYPANGFQKLLLYRGRDQDLLQFEYHEFSGDRTQPEIRQRFVHDLKEGRIITYAGARIEIVDIDGERISYRLVASFTDRESVQ